MDLPPGAVLLDQSFGTTVMNATDIPTEEVHRAMEMQQSQVLTALEGWVRNTQPMQAAQSVGSYESTELGYRNGGLFHRDRYITPQGYFDQIRLAQAAVESDDIVSGVAESTESLAFSAMGFFAEDRDEEDVYNQIAADIDLDSRMREIWRELFTVSQVYLATWWGPKHYKVRGKTKSGNLRRRTIDCRAPLGLTVLDPLKVIPVGNMMFGQERLAYIASPLESPAFNSILQPQSVETDEVVKRLITERYKPDTVETRELNALGVNTKDLWLLNPTDVFRHTLTRPGYRRISPVRLKTVFELLDLKNQLRQMERAHLLGGTNFIVLITKGSDTHPARQEEIAFLQNQVRTVSRTPILVGDHRLNVEIVTPKLDNTLKAERWNTIDSRITGRLYQMFVLGNYSAGASGDDSVSLVKVIARGMESRRHMIRRTMERYIFKPLFDGNEQFTTPPKLEFHPRSIALDFDSAYASFLFDLRMANEISRETILHQFDLEQSLEAENRKREKEEYDDIFQTQVPFSPANPALPAGPANGAPSQNPKSATRDNGGGRRNGGGAAPGSGQGQEPRRRTNPRQTRTAASATQPEIADLIAQMAELQGQVLTALAALPPSTQGDTDAESES